MRLGILGPVLVLDEAGEQVRLAVRQRTLLAALLVRANRTVPVDQLAELVWDGAPPKEAQRTIRSYVVRLRRDVGPAIAARLVTRSPGYLFHLEQPELDMLDFEALCLQASAALRTGAWTDASTTAAKALALWRDEALLDVPSHLLRTQCAPRLEQLRLQAVEDGAEARLRLGEHEGMVPHLRELTSAHPLRERFHVQLMTALARSGRSAEALAAYQGARQVLDEQLGTEPGPELRTLHQRILVGDVVRQPPCVTRMFGMPPRNPFFTGREAVLDQLHRHLRQDGERVVSLVPVHGMGGIGKTQVACEYVYRYASAYSLVCWVNADDATLAAMTLVALATDLGLCTDGPPDTVVGRLWQTLARRDDWLLVYDNVDEPSLATHLHPPDSGRVLITGRNPALGRLSTTVLRMQRFERAESIQLLTRRCRGLSETDADRVAAAVVDLPLAVEQAGCFLDESGLNVLDYLDLLARQPAAAGLADATPLRHPGLAAVVAAGRDRLARSCPVAAELLDAMSFLAAEPLILVSGPGCAVSGVRAGDTATTAEMVRRLVELALARRDGTTIHIHRLIHSLLRERVDADGLGSATRHRARCLLGTAELGDPNDPATWPGFAALTPHALAVTDGDDPVEPALFRVVLIGLLRYLFASGQYARLRLLGQRAYDSWRVALGADHVNTLDAANHLGLGLFELGDHRAAHELHLDTYERACRVLGPEDSRTLRSAGNLSVALFGLGDYRAAMATSQRVLDIRRRLVGDDDLATMRAANGVAAALNELGEYQQARDIYQEWLARSRRVLGPDHPNTLRYANNLGTTLCQLREHGSALALLEDAVSRRTRLLGRDNPQTLTTMANVVEVLTALGRYDEAHALITDVVAGMTDALGLDHPLTVTACRLQVVVLDRRGEHIRARELATNLLARARQGLGMDHPQTLDVADVLVSVLIGLDDHAAALPLATDTVQRYERVVGPGHPHARRARAYMASARSVVCGVGALGAMGAEEDPHVQ